MAGLTQANTLQWVDEAGEDLLKSGFTTPEVRMEISRTQVQQPEQLQSAKRTEAIQREAVREAVAQEQKQPQAQEAEKKPVVNGQGQVIGTRLNVSA